MRVCMCVCVYVRLCVRAFKKPARAEYDTMSIFDLRSAGLN